MHYLIIGSGLFGSVFSHEMAKAGHQITIIEKKNHIGGNVYTKEIEGIQVHQYGAHIFHTSSKKIWDYVNQFVDFNQFINSPISISKGKLYNLPFNMNTFHQMWGIKAPSEAKEIIEKQRNKFKKNEPKNLEEMALSLVGKDIYETLIKEYTEKQWGKACADLPAFIIKRLPVRYTYDNNYFNDTYQGIPKGGYTRLVEKLLDHPNINVHLETNFFDAKMQYIKNFEHILFTGMIDEYYDYCFGELSYRSLKFEHEILETDNFQGNAVVNYNDLSVPFTRIIEHKHFDFGTQKKSIITKEYPSKWVRGHEPYYPINDEVNNLLYEKYKKLSQDDKQVTFGGRLGMYRYYDMHQVVKAALNLAEQKR